MATRRSFSGEFKYEAVRLARERGVTIAQAAANQKWVADFTYLWTAEGWRYIAVVLDLYSRRAVMSRSGNCWANSAMDSFFKSLKTERTDRKVYRGHAEAKAGVLDYIERFDNARRRRSTLGYVSPVQFEQQVQRA